MHDKLGLLVYKEEKQISPVGAVLIFPGGAVLISQGPSDIIGLMSAVHFALPKYYFCGFSSINMLQPRGLDFHILPSFLYNKLQLIKSKQKKL